VAVSVGFFPAHHLAPLFLSRFLNQRQDKTRQGQDEDHGQDQDHGQDEDEEQEHEQEHEHEHEQEEEEEEDKKKTRISYETVYERKIHVRAIVIVIHTLGIDICMKRGRK
jgi:hypothetical protein